MRVQRWFAEENHCQLKKKENYRNTFKMEQFKRKWLLNKTVQISQENIWTEVLSLDSPAISNATFSTNVTETSRKKKKKTTSAVRRFLFMLTPFQLPLKSKENGSFSEQVANNANAFNTLSRNGTNALKLTRCVVDSKCNHCEHRTRRRQTRSYNLTSTLIEWKRYWFNKYTQKECFAQSIQILVKSNAKNITSKPNGLQMRSEQIWL